MSSSGSPKSRVASVLFFLQLPSLFNCLICAIFFSGNVVSSSVFDAICQLTSQTQVVGRLPYLHSHFTASRLGPGAIFCRS